MCVSMFSDRSATKSLQALSSRESSLGLSVRKRTDNIPRLRAALPPCDAGRTTTRAPARDSYEGKDGPPFRASLRTLAHTASDAVGTADARAAGADMRGANGAGGSMERGNYQQLEQDRFGRQAGA